MPSEQADVLSQVLTLIRLRGDHVFHGTLGRATEVFFPPGPASFLHVRAGDLSVAQADGQAVLARPLLTGLPGLIDERVGRALSAIHLEPERAWTVSALAETAMTRTGLPSRTSLLRAARRVEGELKAFDPYDGSCNRYAATWPDSGAHSTVHAKVFASSTEISRNMTIFDRLSQAGLQLPAPIAPLGSYRTVSISGNQVYVSGLGPFENGKPIVGIVGRDISLEAAQHAARLTMLMILSCVDQACGLDNIERCSLLTVYVRAEASFTQHPKVANGASDVLLTLFGQDRLPARSALGMYSLPMGIPVEIDSIFELKR